MDSLEVNKVIAAVLVAGLAFMASGFVAELLVSPTPLKKPAFFIATAAPAAQAAKPVAISSISPLLASADINKGATFAHQVCGACHSLAAGGPTIVGPHLWGVVGRKQASVAGFDYSPALKKLKGRWTYHQLNLWLYDPQEYASGTRMTYTGIKSTKLRADVIAYLRTLATTPAPLPKVTAVAAKAPAPAAAAKAAPAQLAGPSNAAIGALVARADVAKGKAFATSVCTACHSLNKGGPTIVGPNLWGIVGRKQGAVLGFAYSAPFKAKMSGVWTYAELDKWLTDPMTMVPGTMMAFPGIPDEKLRIDVIAFLRTLADKPAPLPATK